MSGTVEKKRCLEIATRSDWAGAQKVILNLKMKI